MASKTKIKKDELGLLVLAGGWISRPFYGTMFKEGDEVKTHHFGGSTNVGVTFNNSEFKFNKRGQCEVWSTTGTSGTEYRNREMFTRVSVNENQTFEEQLKEQTEWYKTNNGKGIGKLYEKQNKEFAEKHKV